MFARKKKMNLTRIQALCLYTALGLPLAGMAQQPAVRQDSITIAIAPAYDSVSKTHRFFLGEGYRKLWAAPVKMRVADLTKEHGGMKVLQVGGGMETRSVRLQDASGKEWALRTAQKYPDRKLPDNLKKTIVKDIVQDQIATGHPYAALIVPPLAEALHIPHANPEVVYVGDDPALGEYRKEFANAVYLLEERYPEGYEKSDNTDKVERKVQERNDTRIDQQLVLRSRLLDFILGDYDRNEGNWRFVAENRKDEKVYVPVPRDRDKVFYKTSGVFPWILSHQWLKANIQPYQEDIRAVDQWNIYQRYFDRFFLNELEEKDWRKEIKYVQSIITPELLKSALMRLPANIYAEGGEETLRIAIARTRNLETSALQYYRFLAKNVDIAGSDKREYLEFRHLPGGWIELRANNLKKDGEKGRKLYRRTFDPAVTKELRVYGMGGEDLFKVTGNTKSPIIVRMIGGDGNDRFEIDEQLHDRSRNFIYDRSDEPNQVPSRAAAKLRLSRDTAVNQYNKSSFVFDRFGPLVRLNYNIDQGLQPGVGLILEKQGFRKEPYASKQEFWADYSTGRNSFILNYAADFKKVLGKTNLKVNANVLGPHNLSNFFGQGNETVYLRDEDKGMSYYRNRYDYLTADVQLYRNFGKWTAGGGLTTEYYTSSRRGNEERFLHDYNQLHPEASVFADRVYAGLVAELKYDSRNTVSAPTRGMYWFTRITGSQQLNTDQERYGKIQTEFRYYLNPGDGGFVIADRIGGGTVFGDPEFFQQMQLGGVHNLRGFHTNRFTGKTMMYNNLDLRLKLFNFTSYIVPGSVGLLGFTDTGRVWQPGQSSSVWHVGYGGGVYVVPAELVLIQAAVGFSRESTMPYISIGFNF